MPLRTRSLGFSHIPDLRICTLNITSLEKHIHEISGWPFDIFILQEVRVSKNTQRRLANTAKSVGFQAFWGHDTERIVRRQSGLVHTAATQGGVAFLVRCHLSCKLFPAEGALQTLHRSGRFLHLGVAIGRGNKLLHLVNYYGISGATSKGYSGTDYAANEKNLALVFDFCRGLGQVPIFVGMDANIDHPQSEAMRRAIFSGAFTLLADEPAIPEGDRTTYCGSGWAASAEGNSRIDHLFANPVALGTVTHASVADSFFIGQHKAVSATVRAEAFRANIWTVQSRGEFPLRDANSPGEPTPLPEVATSRIWGAFQSRFQTALSDNNLEVAWRFLNQAAVLCMNELSSSQSSPGTLPTRGDLPRFRFGPRVVKTFQGCSVTPKLRRAATLISSFKAHAFRGIPPSMITPSNHQLRDWSMLTGTSWQEIRSSPWKVILAQAQACVDKLLRELKRSRVKSWHDFLQQSQKHVTAWTRDKPSVAPALIVPDGEVYATEPSRVHQLLLDSWKDFLQGPTPDIAAFLNEYGTEIAEARASCHFDRVSYQEFREALAKKHVEARGGPDGWQIIELCHMPALLIENFLDLMWQLECEPQASWPAGLVNAITVLLPKPDGGTRPISLCSVWVSVYMSARFKQAMPWLLHVVPPQLHGGLEGRDVLTSELVPALELHHQMEQGTSVVGLTHDRQKCFDLFKSDFVFPLMQALGTQTGFVNMMQSRYRDMQRIFRFVSSFGPWWQSQSLLQGCPISVVACNCAFAILARRVNRACPAVSVSFFLDDSKLRSQLAEVAQLERACLQFRLFDRLSGQRLNPKKCRGFGTCAASRQAARRLLPAEGQVELHPVSLGIPIPTSWVGYQKAASARCQAQFDRLRKIAQLPGTKIYKTALVESCVLPSIIHGVTIVCPSENTLGRLRTTILAVTFSESQKLKEPHLLMACIFKAHRLDPQCTVAYTILCQVRLAILRDPKVAELIVDFVSNPQLSMPGPLHCIRQVLDFLQWRLEDRNTWLWSRPADVSVSMLWPTSLFQHEVRRSLRFALMQKVSRRKDTQGLLGKHVCISSVSHLSRCSDSHLTKFVSQYADFASDMPTPTLFRGWIRQMLSGSTRTGDRLKAAGIWESDDCPGCGAVREEPIHMARCEAWKPSPELQAAFESLPTDARHNVPAFECLSVLVEPEWVQRRRQALVALGPPVNHSKWSALPLLIYTDGSTLDNTLPDATVAGAAYVAQFEGFPQRVYGCAIPGLLQGSDRAEVFAVAHALGKLLRVASSLTPIPQQHKVLLKSDCKWVVERLQALCNHARGITIKDAHHDLWDEISKHLSALSALLVQVAAEWIPAHCTEQQVVSGIISRGDLKANELADKAAKAAAFRAANRFQVRHAVRDAKRDRHTCCIRQLVNIARINKRWRLLKLRGTEGLSSNSGDDAPPCTSTPTSASQLARPSAPCPLVTKGEGVDLLHYCPSADDVRQCRVEVPHFRWKAPPVTCTHSIDGERLSRSQSNFSWHFPKPTLDACFEYFHNLSWSHDDKVSMLELFCDFYAFTGASLVNPKAKRPRPLSTGSDFACSFAAAVRAMPKQWSGAPLAHPATRALVSHLTPF